MKTRLLVLMISTMLLKNSFAENETTVQYKNENKSVSVHTYYNSEKNTFESQSYRYNRTFWNTKKACVVSDDEGILEVYNENAKRIGKINIDHKFKAIHPLATKYLLTAYDDDDGFKKKMIIYDNELNVKDTKTFVGDDLIFTNDNKFAAVAYPQAPMGAGILKVINTETLEEIDFTTIAPANQPFLADFTNKNELIVITPEPKDGNLNIKLINITNKTILKETFFKKQYPVGLAIVKYKITKTPDGNKHAYLAVNKIKRITGERNLPNTIYTVDDSLNCEEILSDGIINDIRYITDDLILITKWQFPEKNNNFNKDSKILVYNTKTKQITSETPYNGANLIDVIAQDGIAYCYFESLNGNNYVNAYEVDLINGKLKDYKNTKLPLTFIGKKKIIKEQNTNRILAE